jgi:hypothetical protein
MLAFVVWLFIALHKESFAYKHSSQNREKGVIKIFSYVFFSREIFRSDILSPLALEVKVTFKNRGHNF